MANQSQPESPLDTPEFSAVLNADLAHTQAKLLQTRTQLTTAETELEDTALPPSYWNKFVRAHLHFLERRYAHAQRLFHRAYKIAQSHARELKIAKSALLSSATEPPALLRPPEPVFRQSADIRIIDGQPVTKISKNFTAAYWLQHLPFPEGATFCRQLGFVDGVVPEPYQYALTHEGITYDTPRTVFLHYSQDEFLRLCQLEIDTNSPHLLDGERLKMERLV